MELTSQQEIKFELISEDGLKSYVIHKKRILIGSGESCDFIIPYIGIEGVHAVLEVKENNVKIYDMNTASGTYLNGKNVVANEAKVGDKICFGDFCFSIESFNGMVVDAINDFPPILQNSVPLKEESIPLIPKRVNRTKLSKSLKGSYDKIEYPLENALGADELEYIFEPASEITNVLHYDNYEKSIEVITTLGDRIFSIDYLSTDLEKFILKGGVDGNGVVFPYLAKGESIQFVEKKQNKLFVQRIDGFEILDLKDKSINDLLLTDDSLIVLMSDHIKIFIRLSDAPPTTLPEPFIKNDRTFWKYFIFVMLMVLVFLAFVGIMDVNEELKEKKAPQKLASILYKKPVLSISVANTKKEDKKVVQKVSKKPPVNKTFSKSQASKSVAPKVTSTPKTASPTTKTSTAKTKSTSKGNIDTYKAVDFAASLPNVLSKSSNFENIKNEQQNDFEYSANGPSAQNLGEEVKLNKLDGKVEDISKAASKNLSDTGELSDFSNNKVMATAGIPSRTIVLGGMDPDTIRKILMDHLPQFRFCYQKELDQAKSEFSGRITLNFVIGASGNVTRAGVKENSMPPEVRGCVVNVLRGIPFPAPRGGGVVEVTQPMNFYPKS